MDPSLNEQGGESVDDTLGADGLAEVVDTEAPLQEFIDLPSIQAASPAQPVTFAALPAPIATIDSAGNLGTISVNLVMSGGTLSGTFNYSAQITYTDHSRNDQLSAQGQSDSLNFLIDFDSQVMGGTFTLTAQIPYLDAAGAPGVASYTGSSTIIGTNPGKQAVKDRLGDMALQLIAYQESKFAQFQSSGLPLFGPPNGFGVMQLDPPSTTSQIWSWTVNVDGGIALFAVKKKDAQTYPGRVRAKFPAATDFTDDQLKMETWQRYNGGGYWQWNDGAAQWQEKSNSGYADKLAQFEIDINGGTPPAGW